VAYLEAVFAAGRSYAVSMAMMAATVFTFAAIVVALGREKKGVEFGAAPAFVPE
jgi:hypothetical protein